MNFTKRDVLELRHRLTKKDCSFTRMSGCYVGNSQNILHQFSQPFLDLDEDVFYKYLEIAKKVLSGTPGANLLELTFENRESAQENRQFLDALRQSRLKNEGMLDRLYEQIIANYDNPGNYLILLFHDIYDVPTRTEDHVTLDESEIVHEYFICAICPVQLSKPGLSYLEDHNCFGPRVRDWLVGMPEIGFVYPAFSKRSSDVNAIMYYVKPGKDSQPQLMQQVLGCPVQRTAHEEKNAFRSIVEEAFGTEQEQAEDALIAIQKNLQTLVATRDEDGLPPIALHPEGVREMLDDVKASDVVKEQIAQSYQNTFVDVPPCAQNLLDSKLAAIGAQREATLALTNKIESLEQQLKDARADDLPWDDAAPAIVLQVPTDKKDQVASRIIDGQKYLVIPLEDGETARINGVAVPL